MDNGEKHADLCSLKFEKYYVDYINFKRNENYDNASSIVVDLNIASNVEFLSENRANVVLILKIFDENANDNIPFSMIVQISGIFSVDNPSTNKFLIEQNALAILFPYARAIVTNYTANANITPLILQPINIVNYMENKKRMKEE